MARPSDVPQFDRPAQNMSLSPFVPATSPRDRSASSGCPLREPGAKTPDRGTKKAGVSSDGETKLPSEDDMRMQVLVTGGGGFIGREVTRELLRHGYRVRILDALIEQVHGSDPFEPPHGAEFLVGDIRDPKRVAEAVEGVDAVIHLAAEVGVGQSMYEIARYVGANDFGTAVLLDALVKKPIERLVVASSMSVYGEGRYRTEDGRLLGNVR